MTDCVPNRDLSCSRKHAQGMRAAGSALCIPCAGQVEHHLRALPDLHRECLHHMPSAAWRRNPTKVSGSRKQDHLNVAAFDARNNALAVLDSWSELTAEKLGVAAPTCSVPHLVRFLLDHLEWLVAQPAAADFADEVEGLHRELLDVVEPEDGGLSPFAGKCVVDGCAGTIQPSSHRTGNAGRTSIGCSFGHAWEIREWLILRHLMDRPRKDIA
ncbi:hypothetical protein ACFP1Z_15585 [Streptomyces gamaensis]|uniref:Uncharacterized protein n=1 Tax=Streptomyces gamaensis TaxID=1763542 RepID=A0ABW0Z3I4_9ACTN